MTFRIPDTPEELFRQGRQGFQNFNKLIPSVIALLLALGVVLSSFYSIEPNELGVIRRFGKYIKTTQPGLHWKLPFNIDRLDKVPVELVYKEEFGFRTVRTNVRTQYSPHPYDDESQMLTGDLNVLDVTWIVQFKVKDPVKLLFKDRNPLQTVRDISEAVMRQVIGDSSVSEALTNRRIEINTEVQQKMQETLDRYQTGIQVTTVKLQDVNPPDEVKSSFNAVNAAKQEKEKVINESWESYNKAIPKAKGEAERTIRESEGYASQRINEAEGDAARFKSMYEAYKLAKEVTRERMYLETLGEVLPQVGHKYIVEPKGSGILPLLQLNGSK